MKTTRLFLGFAATQLLAFAAFAQQPATSEALAPGSSTPAPSAKATPEQKAQGKAARNQDGRLATKTSGNAEGNPIPAEAAKVPKSDRREARTQRKAATARANKAGEITAKGEVGPAK